MGKPTLISLFAGIGGLDLAAHWAGFDTVRFVEKEPFCQKVLAKHWPNVPIDDDVFTSHPGYADVICGGFPCQPFSVAGAQRGRDDERFLLPEMLRIVDEVKPYAVLFENVPGFPSLTDGREFKYLLGTLAEMGFDAEWGHIRASDIGAPHQRERWFCVAYSTGNYGKHDGSNIIRQTQTRSMDLRGRASELAYPTSAGLEGRNGSEPTFGEHTGHGETIGNGRRLGSSDYGSYTTITKVGTQSRIRGASHGLPGWLDFVGFPARPGEQQHAYEPPRTAPSTPTTNARIKALGNAVVPQVAYPIFAAIAEWLAEVKLSEAA